MTVPETALRSANRCERMAGGAAPERKPGGNVHPRRMRSWGRFTIPAPEATSPAFFQRFRPQPLIIEIPGSKWKFLEALWQRFEA